MPAPVGFKRVIRLSGIAVSLVGFGVAAAKLAHFLDAYANNRVDGSAALLRLPEYYQQIGSHYASGFATGFFACYFLMVLAVIAGGWVDEARRNRRAGRAARAASDAGSVGEVACSTVLAAHPVLED